MHKVDIADTLRHIFRHEAPLLEHPRPKLNTENTKDKEYKEAYK